VALSKISFKNPPAGQQEHADARIRPFGSELHAGLDWSLVLSEIGGLAGIRDEPYPKEGIIYMAYSGVRVRWHVRMTSEKTEYILRDLGSDMV